MKVKHFLVISTIALIVFGLAFLVAPIWSMARFDVALDIGGSMMTQLLGGAFLGLAAINWMGRNYVVAEDVRPLIVGNLLLNILGFIVVLVQILAGLGNLLAWVPAGIYLILGLAYGYSLINKRTYEEPTVRVKHT